MNSLLRSSNLNGLVKAAAPKPLPFIRIACLRTHALSKNASFPAASTPAPEAEAKADLSVGPAKFILHQLPALVSDMKPAVSAVALPLLVLGFFALSATPAEAVPQHQYDLSEEMDLLSNVVRYGRFFITVMLGTVSIMTRPFAALFKNPLTGLLAIGALVGAIYGTKFTLELMLGVSEVDTMANSVLGY